MKDLSVILPSRSDLYLQKTVDDILAKTECDTEVIVSLDGYWPQNFSYKDLRVTVIHQGTPDNADGMRARINDGIAIAKGKYVMKLDEHCMLDKGFDRKLIANCEDNWVVIPRRYRLDADKWEIIEDGRPPVDYMKFVNDDGYLHGVEDRGRGKARSDPKFNIDNTQTMQGSCWFLAKSFWDKTVGPMDDENYGPFSQEAQEIGNKAWLSGGRVVVNKNTWYAHWHKDTPGYNFTPEQQRKFKEGVEKGRKYCNEYWSKTKDYKHDLNWLLRKFA